MKRNYPFLCSTIAVVISLIYVGSSYYTFSSTMNIFALLLPPVVYFPVFWWWEKREKKFIHNRLWKAFGIALLTGVFYCLALKWTFDLLWIKNAQAPEEYGGWDFLLFFPRWVYLFPLPPLVLTGTLLLNADKAASFSEKEPARSVLNRFLFQLCLLPYIILLLITLFIPEEGWDFFLPLGILLGTSTLLFLFFIIRQRKKKISWAKWMLGIFILLDLLYVFGIWYLTMLGKAFMY